MKKEETVKLISAEGFEFVIQKDAAMVSHTIRNMLTSPGNFAESQLREVTFPEISTTILQKICLYFHWNLQFASFTLNFFQQNPHREFGLVIKELVSFATLCHEHYIGFHASEAD